MQADSSQHIFGLSRVPFINEVLGAAKNSDAECRSNRDDARSCENGVREERTERILSSAVSDSSACWSVDGGAAGCVRSGEAHVSHLASARQVDADLFDSLIDDFPTVFSEGFGTQYVSLRLVGGAVS